jgi:hypothetical protein
MSGLLIFAGSKEAISRIADERNAYKAERGSDLVGMLDILKQGGVAVASIHSLNTGYSLPAGCDIEFDESCPKEGPERLQAEGRARRLYPFQDKALHLQAMGRIQRTTPNPKVIRISEPGDEDAARIISRLSLKAAPVKSPFDVEIEAEAHHIKLDEPGI